MNRYEPTPDERNALIARGWRIDEDGWWFHCPPRTERGLTYREAVKQADKEGRRLKDHSE